MIPILSGRDLMEIAHACEAYAGEQPGSEQAMMLEAVAFSFRLVAAAHQTDPKPIFEIVVEREDGQ